MGTTKIKEFVNGDNEITILEATGRDYCLAFFQKYFLKARKIIIFMV